jgi:DNA-binding transcriptional ArsR family regulator
MSEAQELTRVFKALAVEARVRIVEMLKGRTLCVGALAARLDVTPGAVSQHLRILRDANLVVPEKRGYFVHYRLNERTLAKWRGAAERFLSPAPTPRSAGRPDGRRREENERCVPPRRVARSQRSSRASRASARRSK